MQTRHGYIDLTLQAVVNYLREQLQSKITI